MASKFKRMTGVAGHPKNLFTRPKKLAARRPASSTFEELDRRVLFSADVSLNLGEIRRIDSDKDNPGPTSISSRSGSVNQNVQIRSK